MNIIIRLEEERDYRRVEEVTKSAFSYPGRVVLMNIGWLMNYEKEMVFYL